MAEGGGEGDRTLLACQAALRESRSCGQTEGQTIDDMTGYAAAKSLAGRGALWLLERDPKGLACDLADLVRWVVL